MDSKRSNFSSKTQASSKTQVIKTASDVSLTPSQAAEHAKQNSRKNPLDALSRMSLRNQTVERRSGLQEVDDEYFKKNVFSKSAFPKHSGLNDAYPAAGQPSLNNTESSFKLPTGGDAQMQMSQAQIQQQQQQQMQQQQQQQQQTQSQVNMQAQAQAQAQSQAQMNAQAQGQGGNMPMPNKMASNVNMTAQQQQQQQQGGEPELCTTCPNCQTTIYLVRGDSNNDTATASMSPSVHGANVPESVNVPAM